MAKKKTKKKKPTLAMVCRREDRVVLAFDARGREVVLLPAEALVLARTLIERAGQCCDATPTTPEITDHA